MFPIITVLTDASETKTFTSAFDLVFAEGGDDKINGAGGDDTLLGNDGDDTLNGGANNDTLYGEADWDTLIGGSGSDILYGGSGWDTLEAGSGLDTLWGGDDIYQDTVSYENATSAVNVDLALGEGYMTGLGKAADLDTLNEIGSIEGSTFGDALKGDGDYNDIRGGEGGDTIHGRGGDDQLTGGHGADKIYGEAGLDTFIVESGAVAGGEVVDGGTGTDTILMTGGGTVDFRGADLVSIEAFRMIPNQPAQTIHMYGEHFAAGHVSATAKFSDAPGSVSVNIQMHNAATLDMSGFVFDEWYGYTIVTGDGTGETVTGTARGETIFGKGGADTLKGLGGDDTIAGGAGDDIMLGGLGLHDTVSYEDAGSAVRVDLALVFKQDTGGGGFDTLSGFERLAGSAFGDDLIASFGNNTLSGNGGDDTLAGGGGSDGLHGGSGFDTANYTASAAAVTVDFITGKGIGGDAAGDTFSSVENVRGSNFADTFIGNSSDNIFEGGGGADAMDGNGGVNTATYAGSLAAVTAALDGLAAGTNDALGDTFADIQNLAGTNVAGAGDILRGNAGNNMLYGLGGNDTIYGFDAYDTLFGGEGSDVLVGGKGQDMLTGGAGKDYFRMTALDHGGDEITDFDGGFDFMSLKASAFGGGLVAGAALKAGQFVAGPAPVASGPGGQFLYNTVNGALSWDANGAAAGGDTLLAHLYGAPVLAIDDFQIF